MTTIAEFLAQKKTQQQQHQMGIDLAFSVLKIDAFILQRLSADDLRLLIAIFHPKRGLSQLSSSELNSRYDEMATAEAYIKNRI